MYKKIKKTLFIKMIKKMKKSKINKTYKVLQIKRRIKAKSNII